ncbi:hypothetical protein DB347_01430 [Opitutaceae bacterium EW11]|nr:hypothetical protein DB347_01430 [Opitutaceae bacterium EW11]
MSTYTRAYSVAQQRHTDASSRQHARDRKAGDKRKGGLYVRCEFRPFGPELPSFLDVGLQSDAYRYVEGEWIACIHPEDYADHIVAQARLRNWYVAGVNRYGVACSMRRRSGCPIEILTTHMEPCISLALRKGELAIREYHELRRRWLEMLPSLFREVRYLVGSAGHLDCGMAHFDTAVSRNDGLGGRIKSPGAEFAGPWATAVDRLLRAGAQLGEEDLAKYATAVAKFRERREPGDIPVDVRLARAMDSLCAEVWPSTNQIRAKYLEQRAHWHQERLKRQLDALEQRAAEIRASIAQPSTQNLSWGFDL